MLTIRLKSFVTSERFIVSCVVFVIVSAVLIALINASGNAHHKIDLSGSSSKSTSKNHDEGIWQIPDDADANYGSETWTGTSGSGDQEQVQEQVPDDMQSGEQDDEQGGEEDVEEDDVPTPITKQLPPKDTSKVDGTPRTEEVPEGAVVEYEMNEPINATISSKTIADELLTALKNRIGNGRGPIIVGGIGDSGTRGVRDVLMHYGTQMLHDGYVKSTSKDSLVYMDQYPTTTTQGKKLMRGPPGLYNRPIKNAHSLKYNSSVVSFDHWHCGRQYVAKMVDRSMTISQRFRGKNSTLDPWGFKHPRTSLLLPFWLASLEDKFVFIHVLRDGKDIIEGDNQKVFRSSCGKYYGRHCMSNLQTRINLWADLNRDVFEFALESGMKADQYFAIRIEDLVLGNEACYRRLAHYLRMPPAEIEARVPTAIKANRGHESSYLGHKWSADIKRQVETVMMHNNHTLPDFEFWGYSASEYKLTKDCDSLPWMKRMREKKGPLPGDSQ